MIILDYKKSQHKQIIHACAEALKAGKSVVYPTDTSYGLAVDATNSKAVKKLYQIKERGFSQPVHVTVPTKKYGKSLVKWNSTAEKLAKKFWPGPLTIVLPLTKDDRTSTLQRMTGRTGFMGLRLPKHAIALDLSKVLGKPITATSANPSAHLSGGFDSYSADDVITQFSKQKYRPDIIINAGQLPKRKPSTLVKIDGENIEILREGPITKKQITSLLNTRIS